MINNIEQIIEFWKANGYTGTFIIHDIDRPSGKMLARYIVTSANFSNKIQGIIDSMTGDRLYISAIPRNIEKVNKTVIKRLIDDLDQRADKLFLSEMAKAENSMERVWKVDIDSKDFDLDIIKPYTIAVFPSVKGYHVLTKPFDRRIIPDVDIQKDNFVLLYAC